jgi:hypothetical protein
MLCMTAVHAQRKLEPTLHALLTNGIDLILKQEYDRADSLFRDVVNRYPRHPMGYLYQAAVMQSYAIDMDVPVERKKFDSLLERGREASAGLDSLWNEYFLGTADGYEAYERVEHGDWFGGIRKGMSSASKFEEVIEQDSLFYDAYVGIGTYYYWRSRKTAFLQWLPLIKDDRELGITMLVVGAERSEYNRFTAMSALVSIALDDEDYTRAEEWSRCGLRFYPENRVFLWGLATALDRQKKNTESVLAYTNLLKSILHARAPHPYNEIVCRLNLVKSKLAREDTTAVMDHLHILLSYEKSLFPAGLQSRAHAKFEEVRTLLSEIEHRRAALK